MGEYILYTVEILKEKDKSDGSKLECKPDTQM